MQPKTNIVVLLGGGLLTANILFDKSFTPLRAGVKSGSLSHTDVSGSPVKMAVIGLVTLMALTIISDADNSAADTILIILCAMWMLWIISYKNLTTPTAKVAP